MTRHFSFLAAVGGVAALGAAALALQQGTPADANPGATAKAPVVAVSASPVLLELFTSQGCSSCPPADQLAEKLATNPNLVVIARPVTYWDRLGWKDTLAREANTELQQDYARHGLAGRNGVYTPQLVVDGAYGVVGSQADAIAAGIKRYGGKGGAAIDLTGSLAKGYTATLSGSATNSAELVLFGVTRNAEVAIGRGENTGRRVAYTNVLRAETKLADWRGGKANVSVTLSQLQVKGADRYALVLREPGGGKVLAARWIV
ncbi:MAG: DUF1223 domain-containing protein [Erythrobacter sp.]